MGVTGEAYTPRLPRAKWLPLCVESSSAYIRLNLFILPNCFGWHTSESSFIAQCMTNYMAGPAGSVFSSHRISHIRLVQRQRCVRYESLTQACVEAASSDETSLSIFQIIRRYISGDRSLNMDFISKGIPSILVHIIVCTAQDYSGLFQRLHANPGLVSSNMS